MIARQKTENRLRSKSTTCLPNRRSSLSSALDQLLVDEDLDLHGFIHCDPDEDVRTIRISPDAGTYESQDP